MKGKRGDGRSDIYALGVMLYEMLTGETPFTGANPFAVMNDRLVNNPVPPREFNPEISPELQEVIYRALEREPENRYSTANEFAWDLEHLGRSGRRPTARKCAIGSVAHSVAEANTVLRGDGADSLFVSGFFC